MSDIAVCEDVVHFQLVRQSAASRSTVLKSLHKPNKQLSTHTISRLKGITEFTLKEMLAFNADLSLKDDALSKIHSALRMLRIHAGNIQVCNVHLLGIFGSDAAYC